MTDILPELKACPFCGDKTQSKREPGWKWQVSCVNVNCKSVCKVEYPILDLELITTSQRLAEEAWNRRSTPTESEKPAVDLIGIQEESIRYLNHIGGQFSRSGTRELITYLASRGLLVSSVKERESD